MNEIAKRTRFASLYRCVSVTALMMACALPSARAQTGFQGTVQPGGLGTPDFSTPGTVVVRDQQTVINWRPNDTSGTGDIDFLPSGQTVLFRNEVSGVSDFTVLNRILPVNGSGVPVSRVVALNGTVQSQINGQTGGSVWFYAPGGIVAGANSVFNVGSLLLTSNDIDTTGGLFGSNGEIRFRGASNVLSSVEVKSGAQINALSTGSYVALVAPRVVQGGTVRVNGAAAYVGAEAADITINGGLFDITISAGTTDANGVVHTGTTERPGATVTDAQHVYMVAVPKNNALTMLLSGSVGYDAAASAVQSGSAVILSAGHDVLSGAVGAVNTTGTAQADISIGAGTWQPDVTGAATGEIMVRSSAAPATHFVGNLDLTAGRAITLRADQGGAITADGDVSLTAGKGGMGGKIDVLTFGGSGSAAGDGQISVAGSLSLDASAVGDGDYSAPPLVGGDATGGQIAITATGGSISAGSLSAYANARGGTGSNQAGNATGGTIALEAATAAGPSGAQAGSISFGSMSLYSEAEIEPGYYFPPTIGGNATGGTISIAANGGSLSAGDIYAYATGTGGASPDVGGTGTGGSITLSSSAAGGLRGNLFITDCASFGCSIYANGLGGYGLNGAVGRGGSILIHATDADLSIGGDLYLNANAIGGGTDYDGLPGRGGDGIGGSVAVESRAGAAGSGVMTFGNIYASADGQSTENVEGPSYNDGDGGSGFGGSVNFLVGGGSLTADGIFASASGLGGASYINCPTCDGGGNTAFQSGTGQGGSAAFLISGGSATIGSLELAANGTGAQAYAASGPGEVSSLAGQGIGGTASLESRGGTLQAGSIAIAASGFGGSGGGAYQADGPNGGLGSGGTASLLMTAGGTGQVTVADDIIIHAVGEGGAGAITGSDGTGSYLAGVGGGGIGGTADVTLAGGGLTAPSLLVSAAGFGGAGGDNGSDGAGGAGGSGTGGTARLSYLNEGHAIGAVTVKADGEGGQAGRNGSYSFDNNGNVIFFYGAGQSGSGGAGVGGVASMLVDVDPAFASLTISADGIGSAGGTSATGANGGTGTGGVAALNIAFGATSVSGALKVSASGFGGAGGTGLVASGGRGGDAFGGSATLGLAGASTSLDASDISVLAEALGGSGGANGLQSGVGLAGLDGGNATGGTALFAISGGASALSGALFQLSGDATGGAGSAGTAGAVGGAGGSGGGALGGSATLRIDGGRLRINGGSASRAYAITAVGQGGAGADGGVGSDPGLSGGAGGNGGSGTGGSASFDANDADFALGDLSILANGLGGVAGLGGSGPGGSSPSGLAGGSSGGTASLAHGGGAVLTPGVQRVMGSLSMSATGDSGGRLSFADSTSAAGGGLQISGALALDGAGAPVAGFTGIAVSATGNPVQVGGTADFTTEGPLSFAFAGSGGLAVTGTLTGYSGTRIDIDHTARTAGSNSLSAASMLLRTAGGISLTGDSRLSAGGLLTLLALGGDLSLSSGSSASAGGDLRLFAQGSVLGAGALSAGGRVAIGLGGAGDIRLGSLSSGGLLDMADASGNALGGSGISIGGDLMVSGLLAVGPGSGTLSARSISLGSLTGGSQTLSAPAGVTIGDADLAGLLQISTPGAALLNGSVGAGAIDVSGGSIGVGAIVARAGNLSLRSVADLTIGSGQATGNMLLQSSGGSLTIGSASAGGLLTLRGAGIGAQALVSGGAALLDAGAGGLIVNDIAAQGAITAVGRDILLSAAGAMTIANASASGAVTLNAGGLLSLLGPVGGSDVGLSSADIVIGGPVAATGQLRFGVLAGQQPAVIGGGDVAGGYSLSAAELARVAAADIRIAGAGDIVVRDLTIGTAVLPAAGVLGITTPGTLRVEGALRMTGRSGQGGLSLSAGQRLEVIADSGFIEVDDGNGGLAGVLTLASPVVYAASLAAIADVDAASNVTARDLRLSLNDGLVNDAGLLRAGAIRIDARDGVYIQNSGVSASFFDRRGFTANSLTISATSGRPQIAINGRLALSTGGYAAGLTTIPLVAISGGFAAGSRINGCLIANTAACTSAGAESRDSFEGRLDPSASIPRILPVALIQLRDIVAQGYPPLIDEPVTGAGNEDLWERRCGGEGEPACEPQ